MIPSNTFQHEYVDRGTGKCARMCCDKPKEHEVHTKDLKEEKHGDTQAAKTNTAIH